MLERIGDYGFIVTQFVEHLGVTDTRKIKQTTPKEMEYLMKGVEMKRVSELDYIHKQAWANQQATATNSKGDKSAYKDFTDFFDYEKTREDVLYAEINEDEKKKESENLRKIAERVKELG